MLTKEQLRVYNDSGCLCLENFISRSQCQEMIDRGRKIVEDFDPAQVTIFRSKNRGEQTQYADTYFIDSSSNISCFFEEKAFDEEGRMVQPKEQCINKIGHALHELDPVFREFGTSERMKGVLKDLGFQQPLPVQSTFIFKQPNIGGEVAVHQDATFLYTDPPTVVGLWVALEDASRTNGCLWHIPGSHKFGSQPQRRFKHQDGKLIFDNDQMNDFNLDQFVPLDVKAGTLVIIHGLNIHYSAENTSDRSRCAYILHAYEGPQTHWSRENWLQRSPHLPLRPLYAASQA